MNEPLGTFDEFVDFFIRQCSHLPEGTRTHLEHLRAQRDARRLFLFLESLRVKGEVESPEYEHALTEFYGAFC